ncbi:hypothetical protein [Maribellus mangrovi]|uniref:hypothetical protein n=1 Tax=Maribellus mangrovi TaxID=3133146 RepID=UPI0030EBAE53
MNGNINEQSELNSLQNQLNSLEERVLGIEKLLQELKAGKNISDPSKTAGSVEALDIRFPFQGKGSIETGIGEYGMAWLGNIVLLFGITFLVQSLVRSGNILLSVLSGYLAVALIYIVARYSSKTYTYLSRLLYYNGHLILYVITLRLHFFQDVPIITNPFFAVVLLFGISLVLFLIAYNKKFQFLATLAFLMALFTGIVSNSTQAMLGAVAIVSALTLFLYYRFNWIKLVYVFITLAYFVFLNWLLNNPFITNEANFREQPDFGMFYLFLPGLIFSTIALLPKKEELNGDWITTALIWNGMGFTTALVLMVLHYFSDNFILIFTIIAGFCLIYSVLLKKYSILKIAASMYAIYGFVAMSIFIFGIFKFPRAYLLLSVQSFLVVSMALWFRSRFLVLTNTLLFFLLLIFYIKAPATFPSTDFTFVMVAFITARVMNWKKDRLNLKTEFIRNLYLLAGFAMTLISLYHAIPKTYVTVSWIIAALLFFIVGYLLKNIKYRWLGIGTMIASFVNLVFVDMKNMDITFRVLIFLFLAIISIAVSVIYTRFVSNRNETESIEEEPTK